MAEQRLIDDLFAKLKEERESLLRQAHALTAEQANFAPADAKGEGEWTPKQQWAHMAEMETNYRSWIRAALSEDNPSVGDGWEPVAIGLAEAHEHSTAELVDQLIRERDETLRLLRAIGPEQFDRAATHRGFGTLTIMQWARSYYRHDRMHRDQIDGREPDYQPRFAGGQEPDQRRHSDRR